MQSPTARSRRIFWALPAYNEAASIEDLLDRIAEVSSAAGWDWCALVVDDGSADQTAALALRKKHAGLPVEVLQNPGNQGLGFTIRRALRAAADAALPADVIVTLDADLTQHPRFAVAMVERIDEGYDVAIASRYRPGSGVEGVSTLRRLLSFGAGALVALARPVRGVRDYSCGFRAYRAEIIQKAFARHGDDFVSERGFACMLEIAENLRESAAFVEVPFVLRYQEKRKASAIRILPTIGAYFRVIGKVAARNRKPVPVTTLAIAATGIACGAVGQLLLRIGAQQLAGEQARALLINAIRDPAVLTGLALYAVSSVLWLGVLSRMELSVAYPLGASGYVLVVLLAALAGEPVPALRWLGVGIIAVGVLLVGWLGVAPVVRPRPR